MRKALVVFIVGLSLGMFGVSAHAQLPKSGKYSLYYSWHATGQMIPLAETEPGSTRASPEKISCATRASVSGRERRRRTPHRSQ